MCTLTAVASTSTSTLQIRQQQKPAQGPSQAIGMNNLSGVAKSSEKNITKTKQPEPEMTLVSEIIQPTVLTPEVVLEKVRDLYLFQKFF